MYSFLKELVFSPENLLRPVLIDTIVDLQLSLRIANELTDDLLE
jgi:hypothetical protein